MLVVIIITLSACASNSTKDISSSGQNPDFNSSVNPDPYEKINRKIFKFNEQFDDKILIPFAKGYRKYLPRPIRIAIYNFFSNTAEGRNLVNSLLQGKVHNAVDTFSRIFINSTLGLFGLIDIASQSGLERHVEDIGQTLAVWGAGFGPYIVIPILGPSSGRDSLGLISYFTYEDPLGYLKDTTSRVSLLVVDLVDTRSRYLRASTVFGFAAVDPYLFARESYFQQRLDFIYDGLPPIDDYVSQ
ncbi:MAG: VacJ family lipoprotein [Pseudomonadota bacterium]|nr:VacJ family lipoprotein [Pseudomonadota bacterium]